MAVTNKREIAKVGIVAGFVFCLSLIAEPVAPQLETATVKQVISTDTVVVATDADPNLWVSLLGVGKPSTADPRKDKHLLGQADPNWLETWLPRGTPVLIERHGVDYLGRPLVIMYRVQDRFCWNAYLIKTGGAFAHEQSPFPEFRKFLAMERDARDQRKGLWNGYPDIEPASTLTDDSRSANAPLQLANHLTGTPSTPPSASPKRTQTVFSPENFSPPKRKPRYASQEQARAEVEMAMGTMFQNMMSGGSGGGYGGGYGRPKNVHVNGYYRSNGTYVQTYWRSAPSR